MSWPDTSDLKGEVRSVCERCLSPIESMPDVGSILQAFINMAKVISAGYNCHH